MDNTNWYRDYCTHAQAVDNNVISYGDSCSEGGFLHHSFMYKVKLRNPRNENRQLLNRTISFTLTGGQRIDYNSSNKTEEYFILQNSPKDSLNDTGIKYMGTRVSYDIKNNCVYHSAYIHSDYRHCPDNNFHKATKGQCLSIEKLRQHYTE